MTLPETDKSHKLVGKLRRIFTDVFYFAIGVVALPFVSSFFAAAIPAIAYRWLISQLVLKCFQRQPGSYKLVRTGFETQFALEYLDSLSNSRPSRDSILSSTTIKGIIPYHDIVEKVQSGWIDDRQIGNENQLQYPEFQSYLDIWMGYAYWVKDENFDLSNHMRHHNLDVSVDLDEYVTDLYEEYFNRPFPKKRSPWEMHVIHGWKRDPTEIGNKNEVTVLLTWSHHVLGDGLSLMCAVSHGILKRRMLDLQVVSTGLTAVQQQKLENDKMSVFQKVKASVEQVVRIVYQMGIVVSYTFWRTSQTRFHAPNRKKSWRFVYERSNLIPMAKVKRIKEYFGVRFTSVINSCLASALAKYLNEGDSRKNFVMAGPVVRPGHSLDRLENHVTGNAYKLPVSANMNSVKRLLECDRIFRYINRPSPRDYAVPLVAYAVSCHIAPIAWLLFKNRKIAVSLSNLAGPRVPVKLNWNGNNTVVEVNAAVGPYAGIAGLVCLLFSYDKSFTLNAVAENACMSKEDLRGFMKTVEEEIDYLHELVIESSQRGSMSTAQVSSHHVVVPLLTNPIVPSDE